MSETPTGRPRPTAEGFRFRRSAPSMARAFARLVTRGKPAPRILAAAALVLLVAVPAFMLAQKPQPARRQAALNSLNSFLGDTIHPAEMSQAKGLNRQQFSAWLKRARLPLGVKGAYREWLGPVLTAPRFATVLLRGVSLKEGGKSNLVLVGIPPSLQQKYDGLSLVIIREPWGDGDAATDSNVNGGPNTNGGGNGNGNGNGNGGGGNGNGNGGLGNDNGNVNVNNNSNTIQVDGCRYRRCYNVNPDNYQCTSTFQSTTPCPANECTVAADCGGSGGGGGGGGNFDIFEALTTF